MEYKKKLKMLFLLFLILSSGWEGQAQISYISNKSELPSHPRLLLFQGEEGMIQKNIASFETWKKVNQTILSWCDTLIGKPPVERILTGKRLLGPARECLSRVCYLSYAWRITKDWRYMKRAEKEMLAAASFSDWNPDHFLDVAEFTMALSIGYDWLYNDLSKNSRKAIREAIIKNGLEPSLNPNYSGWLSRPSNWNQVCNAGMTYGALAIFESNPALAAKIINRAIETISLPMHAYNPDGAYNEGYGYWGYGTTFNVMFLSAIEKVFKTDFGLLKNEGFYKTAGYMNHMSGLSGESFNYSDNGSVIELHPAMFWFAQRLKNNSLLWSEKPIIDQELKNHYKFLPVLMIWGAGIDPDNIPKPKEKMWVGNGRNPVALMRTSWNNPNAIFVGIKGGTCSVGHSHMDIGSFVMEAEGVRWAMDFGPQGYNSLESKGIDLWNGKQNSQRWQVFRYNNFVHNTLTINNKLQLVDGYAPLTGSSSDKTFTNATFDLTGVYKDQIARVNRGIAIVNQKYVVVRDELETSETEAKVRWTLLTSADVKLMGNGSAELTKNGKKLLLKVQEPRNVVMKTWSTTSPNDYDAPNPGTILVGFETMIPAKSKVALSVFLIPEKAINNVVFKVSPLIKWNK